MRVSATADVVRIMGVWVRRADAGLARSAAENAATSVQALRVRDIDEARALRDLRNISPAETASTTPAATPEEAATR